MRWKLIAGVVLAFTALNLATRAQTGSAWFQRNSLAQRIAHTNPSQFGNNQAVHNGPGALHYMPLFNSNALDTNLYFLHRGYIEPKSGIGGHFHNYCEEMFVIFDGEAEFTIDGRTSRLKGPAGAPVRMGHWHAIYNPTDQPVQWMNINVSLYKGQYDAFNLNDGRVGVPIDPIPQFMTMTLDPARAQVVPGAKGEVKYRRALDPTVFLGPWGYFDHYVLGPGAATSPTTDRQIGGFYYVISGKGRVTIGTETADIAAGDAVPILLNDTKSFENTGTEPLQLLNVGIVSDMAQRNEILNPTAGMGGARGAGRGAARGAGRGAQGQGRGGAGQGRGPAAPQGR
jgi:mannose-6-phosphate isomerase-like protein (cupin superfamily)